MIHAGWVKLAQRVGESSGLTAIPLDDAPATGLPRPSLVESIPVSTRFDLRPASHTDPVMPIRFHCSNCQQRLSVAPHKAGQEVKCPRCRRVVRVPASGNADSVGTTESSVPQQAESFPELAVPESAAGNALVYATNVALDETPNRSVAQNVSIPRYAIYTQGFLLGAVALAFFVFGLIVGSRSSPLPGADQPGIACSVSGTILCEGSGSSSIPDQGAVVILFPVTKRPDEKGSAEGLGPESPDPADDHPTLAMLRSLGGDYARVDRRGRYRVRAAGSGRYYLLIVSKHVKRASGEQPKATDLAQLGRYFVPASQLLGQQRYQWTEIQLRTDRVMDVSF